jgi:hypothetical protein
VQRGGYWNHGHPWWKSQAQGGERSRRRHSYKNKYTHKLRENCKTLKSLSLSENCKTLNSRFSLWALQNPKSLVSSLCIWWFGWPWVLKGGFKPSKSATPSCIDPYYAKIEGPLFGE